MLAADYHYAIVADNTEDVFLRAMTVVQKHLGPIDRVGGHEPLLRLEPGNMDHLRTEWLSASQHPPHMFFLKGGRRRRRYTGFLSSLDGLFSARFASKAVENPELSWALFSELACETQCHFGCATRLSDGDMAQGLPSKSVQFLGRQRQISQGVTPVVAAGILGRGIPDAYRCMAFGAIYQDVFERNRMEQVSCETVHCRDVLGFRLFDSNTDESGWEQHKARVLQALGERVLWSLQGGVAPALFSERMAPLRLYEMD